MIIHVPFQLREKLVQLESLVQEKETERAELQKRVQDGETEARHREVETNRMVAEITAVRGGGECDY